MNARIPRNLLFRDFKLYDSLESAKRTLAEEIGAIEQHRFLNTSQPDLETYFADKFRFDVPELLKKEMSASQSERQQNMESGIVL